jgi:hypothetical protein
MVVGQKFLFVKQLRVIRQHSLFKNKDCVSEAESVLVFRLKINSTPAQLDPTSKDVSASVTRLGGALPL